MIKIQRTLPRDSGLLELLDRATSKLRSMAEQSDRQERLRFDMGVLRKVKPDLTEMCRGKCAYCESRLDVASRGDVENFRPKGGARGLDKDIYAPQHYWWLAFDWDNLLVSCQICNQKYKRDYFPLEDEARRCEIGTRGLELQDELPLLIDPTLDEPSEHIVFEPNGNARGVTKRGAITIELIGLNREDLVQFRRKAVEDFENRLEIIGFTTDYSNDFTARFVEYVNDLCSSSPSQEYAAIQRVVFDVWRSEHTDVWEKILAARGQVEPISGSTEPVDDDKVVFDPSYKSAEPTIVGDEPTPVESAAREEVSQIKRFSIKKVTIKNFRSIKDLTLEMQASAEADGRESWMLLLGDNGIGKSSILQAIALALSSKQQLEKLDLDVHSYLAQDETEGSIEIQSYESSAPITLTFDEKGFHSNVTEAPCFVLGYGSTRLLPKGPIQPETAREQYLNVSNLFDYSVALRDPSEWLKNIDPDERKERVEPAFFDVLALREGDRISVDSGRLNITQFGESHDLEHNSDGFKTITALVSDMMQTLSIEKANYHNSYGIVLIDEIGNHLHPRWRLKIAGSLRRAFPKLQFVVTTHEPLCLRGLNHGEVTVLVRDQEHEVRAIGKDMLPDHSLLRIDQLLTSDLFGLINIYDEKTEKTYEEYYELLSKPSRERTEDEAQKVEALSAELSGKEILGSSPQVQAVYKIVNETFVKKFREEGFKLQSELKEETISEVKQLLEEEELDWL